MSQEGCEMAYQRLHLPTCFRTLWCSSIVLMASVGFLDFSGFFGRYRLREFVLGPAHARSPDTNRTPGPALEGQNGALAWEWRTGGRVAGLRPGRGAHFWTKILLETSASSSKSSSRARGVECAGVRGIAPWPPYL
jgi:hypothetical protein